MRRLFGRLRRLGRCKGGRIDGSWTLLESQDSCDWCDNCEAEGYCGVFSVFWGLFINEEISIRAGSEYSRWNFAVLVWQVGVC